MGSRVMGSRARAKGAQGRPRRAPSAPQAATAGAFGVGEASDEVTVRGQLPVLSGSHRALRTCCTSAVMDLWVRTYRVKAAAQKRRRITLLLWYAPPAPDQAQGGLQPRPASASLGQLIYSGWPAIPALFGHAAVLEDLTEEARDHAREQVARAVLPHAAREPPLRRGRLVCARHGGRASVHRSHTTPHLPRRRRALDSTHRRDGG